MYLRKLNTGKKKNEIHPHPKGEGILKKMAKHYGKTPLQIQQVREKIRKIVNYRCYFCNKDIRKVKGNGLNATTHHVIPKQLMREDCWNMNNLKCICRLCHNKIEKMNNKIFSYLKRHYKLDLSRYYKKKEGRNSSQD